LEWIVLHFLCLQFVELILLLVVVDVRHPVESGSQLCGKQGGKTAGMQRTTGVIMQLRASAFPFSKGVKLYCVLKARDLDHDLPEIGIREKKHGWG